MRFLQRALPAAFAAAVLIPAAGCGGGGSGGRHPNPSGFFLRTLGTGIPAEVRLDQELTFVFSDPVLPSSVHFDTIRIRAGADEPRGVFVRGVFLFDVLSGTRVVVDPDQIDTELLEKIEKTGRVDLVPRSIRYDLGASSDRTGRRQALFDRWDEETVTFVPEVPERPDLSDLGFQAGTTYTVTLPVAPAETTLESEFGQKLRTGREQSGGLEFTTVALSDPILFASGESVGRPRIIHVDPPGGSTYHPVDAWSCRARSRWTPPRIPSGCSPRTGSRSRTWIGSTTSSTSGSASSSRSRPAGRRVIRCRW